MLHGHLVRQGKRLLRCVSRSVSSSQRVKENDIFPSVYFYRITPSTRTEVVAHDVKAASTTKALYIDCLPPGIESSSPATEFHKSFKKAILETFFFEPTARHMYHLRDRKENKVIVHGLQAEFLKYLYAKVDHTACKMMVDRSAAIEHAFFRSLPDRGRPASFLVQGNLAYNIVSDVPAQPLFTAEQCQQTVDLPVEWEELINCTQDIETATVVDNIIPGYSSSLIPSHPYMRVLLDTAPGDEWSDTGRARGIYFLFARLASEAIRDGYKLGDVLDTPKVGVYISTSAYSYHVIFYQLNTLDLLDDGGVKNLAWGQSVDNITTNLMPYKMVCPENLLGPEELHNVADLIKHGLLYDLPVRDDVHVE